MTVAYSVGFEDLRKYALGTIFVYSFLTGNILLIAGALIILGMFYHASETKENPRKFII